MKKAAAAVLAVIMTALICTGCFGPDPLVVSHQHAQMLANDWTLDGKSVIHIGLDDDNIGYINYTTTPDDPFSDDNIGNWRIDYTTLYVYWESDILFGETEDKGDVDPTITYIYADDLSDEIIGQGKDAIQEVYKKNNEEHQWYASDKYLCLDDLVFICYKDR